MMAMMNDPIMAAMAPVPVQSDALTYFGIVSREATGCRNHNLPPRADLRYYEQSVLFLTSYKELNVKKSVQKKKKNSNTKVKKSWRRNNSLYFFFPLIYNFIPLSKSQTLILRAWEFACWGKKKSWFALFMVHPSMMGRRNRERSFPYMAGLQSTPLNTMFTLSHLLGDVAAAPTRTHVFSAQTISCEDVSRSCWCSGIHILSPPYASGPDCRK